MKILFFNYEYPPLGGGAGNATAYILQEFSQIPDLKVDLITSSVNNIFEIEKIGKNIFLHKLPIGDKVKNLHYQSQKDLLIYTWKAFWYSQKLLKKEKYDLTHSFFTVPCGFISLLIKWFYKIPYLVSLRGADVPGYSDRFPVIYFFLKPLIKLIWSQAEKVIANSQGLKELALQSKPNQKIEIIFNGIDTQEFQPGERENGNIFSILCVSRITERKGIRYLIEAVKFLEKENIYLSVVGEGDQKKELEELVQKLQIKEKVKFWGRLEHTMLPQIYQSAQVFVLPSFNEGMSNTILEALATGLPIIATNTGGTQELVTEGQNGFIIEMGNAQKIAEKIKLLFNDPEMQKQMSLASRKKSAEMSWRNVAQKYFNLYQNAKRN